MDSRVAKVDSYYHTKTMPIIQNFPVKSEKALICAQHKSANIQTRRTWFSQSFGRLPDNDVVFKRS